MHITFKPVLGIRTRIRIRNRIRGSSCFRDSRNRIHQSVIRIRKILAKIKFFRLKSMTVGKLYEKNMNNYFVASLKLMEKQVRSGVGSGSGSIRSEVRIRICTKMSRIPNTGLNFVLPGRPGLSLLSQAPPSPPSPSQAEVSRSGLTLLKVGVRIPQVGMFTGSRGSRGSQDRARSHSQHRHGMGHTWLFSKPNILGIFNDFKKKFFFIILSYWTLFVRGFVS